MLLRKAALTFRNIVIIHFKNEKKRKQKLINKINFYGHFYYFFLLWSGNLMS